jgi:tRNA(His) guanylyltransferase
MKFEQLDKRMRAFEENLDQFVLPGVFMVARLDGRSFTRLTKELLDLDKPFDEKFRDAMIETTTHLMSCGFKIIYGYCQSDEISLLFDRSKNSFGRKTRKLLSVLAGEASATFTREMNAIGVFDCRIIPLPTEDLVVDYFRWRAEDAGRNALSAWCYRTLRKTGATMAQATKCLDGKSAEDKNQLLFEQGINYNDIPVWQKRGVGCLYETSETLAANPVTEAVTSSSRRRLQVQKVLPLGVEYDLLMRRILIETKVD